MQNISSRFEYSVYSKEAQKVKVLASLRAKAQDAERTPVAVSAVLDRSGSMSGSKLKLVKSTARFMVNQLTATDKMGVIAYDDEVRTVASLQSMDDVAKSRAATSISRVQVGGCTNLSGGLLAGVAQVAGSSLPPAPAPNAPAAPAGASSASEWTLVDDSASPTPRSDSPPTNAQQNKVGPVSSVMLFTDGLANRGICETDPLVAAVKACAAEHSNNAGKTTAPPKVHCFGFGADHDPAMLQALAGATGGTYYYLESADAIPAAFADALGGLLSTVAQGAEVTITPLQRGAALKVHACDYPTKTLPDGSVVVSIGDLYAEEAKDLVLEAELPKCTSPDAEGETELLAVSVRFLDVAAGAYVTRETKAIAMRARDPPADLNPDELVTEHALRLEVAAAMKEAVELGDKGDLKKAQGRLAATKQVMDANVAMVAKNVTLQSALADLQDCTKDFETTAVFQARGCKKARAYYTSHGAQRSKGVASKDMLTAGAPPATYMNFQQRKMCSAAVEAVLNEEEEEPEPEPTRSSAPVRRVMPRPQKSKAVKHPGVFERVKNALGGGRM